MSAGGRVAIVTGSNKGIGFEVVRDLCKKFNGDVFLTARNDVLGQEAVKILNAEARDEVLGQEAVKALNAEGLKPKFHQLDITDSASIERLKTFLQSTYGGLDVLVNNAAIAILQENATFGEKAEGAMESNFWGTLNVCRSLFPILKPHARVVNVSSRGAHMSAKYCSDELKVRFTDPKITVPETEELMREFIRSAKDGSYQEKGWPDRSPYHAYYYSKIGVTLMTFAQQREFDKDPRQDIIVNTCCPGFVDTDMTNHTGRRKPEDGADTLIYLALLPENAESPKGAFVAERKDIGFKSPDFPFDAAAGDMANIEF